MSGAPRRRFPARAAVPGSPAGRLATVLGTVALLGAGAGCRCDGEASSPRRAAAPAPSREPAPGSARGDGPAEPTAAPPEDAGAWRVAERTGPPGGFPVLVEGRLVTGIEPVALVPGGRLVLDHPRGPRVALDGPFSGLIASDGDPRALTIVVAEGSAVASVPPAGPSRRRPDLRLAGPTATLSLASPGRASLEVAGPGPRAGTTTVQVRSGRARLELAGEDAAPGGPPQELTPGAGSRVLPGRGDAGGLATGDAADGPPWEQVVELAFADAVARVEEVRERQARTSADHHAISADLGPAEPPRVDGRRTPKERAQIERRARARALQADLVAQAREMVLARARLRFAWERLLAAGVPPEAWRRDEEPAEGTGGELRLRRQRGQPPPRLRQTFERALGLRPTAADPGRNGNGGEGENAPGPVADDATTEGRGTPTGEAPGDEGAP
ncbi:MAG TPA: hypothetical protein RMF84_11245 [Polyangiaceae bacterium LLY-WYZ-14_1]|nr:hypothetical protein [Polyangiaceae bacterium LLY-WYZ-14_1]